MALNEIGQIEHSLKRTSEVTASTSDWKLVIVIQKSVSHQSDLLDSHTLQVCTLTVFQRKRTKYWAARNGGLILIEKKLRFPWNERPHSFVSTRVVSSYICHDWIRVCHIRHA